MLIPPGSLSFGLRLLGVAGRRVDRLEVALVVGPTFGERDDVVGLIGAGVSAHMADAVVALEDES
jgi:hypothetical protein